MEVALAFAAELERDEAHSVETASSAVGVRARTVRDAIARHDSDKCGTDEDVEVCAVLAAAKAKHLLRLRRLGFDGAKGGNRAATGWLQWQLEVQDPLNHPRKSAVELSGPGGKPIALGVAEMSTDELVNIIRETDPT